MYKELNEAVSYTNYQNEIDKSLFNELISYDPTSDKGYKYSNWIIQKVILYAKQNLINYRDRQLLEPVRNLLKNEFEEFSYYPGLTTLNYFLSKYDTEAVKKTFPQKYKNIFNFKTLEEFLNFMNSDFGIIIEKSKEAEAFKDSTIIYRDENKILIIPKTKYSAWYFGQDTEWCTSREGSDSYFNQYKEVGTIFIYAVFDDEKNRYDGRIQMFIPNAEGERLAECRDAMDKTIFGEKLFRQFDSTIISKLQKKWEDLEDSNTDQWEEGTGYLEPDVLSPDEEEEQVEHQEEVILRIEEERVEDTGDGTKIEYSIEFVQREYDVYESGEILDIEERSLERRTTELTFYDGKEFFDTNNLLAMEILKNLLDPENAEDEDVKIIPDLLENCKVFYFDEGQYPVSYLINRSDIGYDDSDDGVDYLFKDAYGTAITICDLKSPDGDDTYRKYDINSEVMIKARTSRELAFDMKFEGREFNIIINVIDNRYAEDSNTTYPKFIDSNLAKLIKGEIDFIRDDEREAKYGQQFMKYEHKKLMNYLKKFYEKRNPVNLTKSKKLITLREER
jgi:hypothetical protein